MKDKTRQDKKRKRNRKRKILERNVPNRIPVVDGYLDHHIFH